ncbi:MAG: hypothetical protein CK424_05270 [Legionella sp.]|nr:MAG: hypothetical protein CK424_05270 [Legionella sp.]
MKAIQALLRFRSRLTLPMILQHEIAECGHACIAMITGFWGYSLDLSALRRLNQPSVRGMNLRQMTELFDRFGFKTRVIQVSLPEVHLIKTPAIAHWNNNHFVVLKQIKRNKIIVHDPSIGVRRYQPAAFARYFSGVVLEVEKSHTLQAMTKQSKFTIWTLFKTMPGMSRIGSLLLGLSILIEGMQIIHPMFMQYVTDYVVGSNALGQMYVLGGGCILFVLLQGLTEFLRSHLVLYTSIQVTESFASTLFQHLIRLPLAFFSSRHLTDIQSKFQSIDHLKTKLSTDFIHTFLDGLMMVFILGVMFLYSPILASMVCFILFLYASSLYGCFRGYKQQASAAIALHVRSTLTFFETLQALASIKVFVKEQVRFQIWRNHYTEALNHDIQVSKLQIRYRILNQVLFHMEYILVVCVGANLVMSQQLSIGMLLAFLAYRLMLVHKASSFLQYIVAYQLLSIQLERLSDLNESEPEKSEVGVPQIILGKGVLCLKDIFFQYPGQEKKMLENISIIIQPGEKIVITGHSGCGKTTLLKIMMGLQSPVSGTVLVDELPLPLFGIQNFRQLSAAVMQDDMLFTGSILDNIVFFAEDVDMARVYHVAQLACIHDTIITFPMGYESLMGQMGTTISGGQKQRLLLARALYKNPRFLFLDEATSHLDLETEQSITVALRSLNLTQIIVAHRQETIAMADRVIHLS